MSCGSFVPPRAVPLQQAALLIVMTLIPNALGLVVCAARK
jgi:hypothetical protein